MSVRGDEYLPIGSLHPHTSHVHSLSFAVLEGMRVRQRKKDTIEELKWHLFK
jgi:hypothetical protein